MTSFSIEVTPETFIDAISFRMVLRTSRGTKQTVIYVRPEELLLEGFLERLLPDMLHQIKAELNQ